MLQLSHIKKDYPAGTGKVEALKGIDLQFRQSEFVSILGPSGCGKTTMLNIIGGLDGYTDGDLVINGRSTKDFKDRDWDAYRNHSIGFVFQSYNLIPHQTVLQNVELALTLSGVSRKERRRRAIQALKDVGLGDQLKKKPGQMSGGQMQRVAIARALVNDPDIILADEPTGALDTETSVQVMEILKKISENRLIIMVTHNPELAQAYSSRIIRMLDGEITHDSMPLTDAEKKAMVAPPKEKKSKAKMPSMSFGTSFMLSLKNLFTKKGRTTLTAFAGSIGIIGIALILAISQGMTAYINAVQESTLSAYPLTLEASTVELSSLMQAFMNVASDKQTHENDAVYEKTALYDMIRVLNSIEESQNDLKTFKKYLDEQIQIDGSSLNLAINGVQYTYDLDLQIYTENVDGQILHTDLQEVLTEIMARYTGVNMSAMSSASSMSSLSSMNTMRSGLWQELLPGTDGAPINDLLLQQYDLVYGSWPNEYDEIVIVVDKNNEIDDITLYALGLLSTDEIHALADAAANGTQLGEREVSRWTYEQICNIQYRTVLGSSCYRYDEKLGLYTDLRDTEAGMRYLYDNALELKVTGIIRPNPDADTTMLSGNICYTSMLTRYVVEQAQKADVVQEQLKSQDRDIITGKFFQSTTGSLTDGQKREILVNCIQAMNTTEKATAYVSIRCIAPEELVQEQLQQVMQGVTREQIEATLAQGLAAQMGVGTEEIEAYLSAMSDEELQTMYAQIVQQQIREQYAQQVMTQLSKMEPEILAAALDAELPEYTQTQCATYYDEIMEFSDASYEERLLEMGYVELDNPASIQIYASSFENKDIITDAIEAYNATVGELQQIKYTDYIGLMISSVTTIINAISYVLIAFVAISLIVSSIMIGVITLISVQERTKEIGILRAIGASKKNVSSMFNAETMIVGFAAGVLGVGVTYLLCIPINLILHQITGIRNLNAVLPIEAAAILVLISVGLTMISGLIPSRSAAKKDPVVALRTE